jgi:hypothetical protein
MLVPYNYSNIVNSEENDPTARSLSCLEEAKPRVGAKLTFAAVAREKNA